MSATGRPVRSCSSTAPPAPPSRPEWFVDLNGIPILLDLTGREVVVVGGGSVAARRVSTFVEAGARVVVIAPVVSAEVERSGAVVLRRPYAVGDLSNAWLVVTATADSD